GAIRTAGCRVARRQDHPIGVELEGGNLRCRKVSVVRFSRLSGWRQNEPRLGVATDLTGERTMGREVDHPIFGELVGVAQTLDLRLCGTFAKLDKVTADSQVTRHGTELVRRFGQRYLRADLSDVGKSAAEAERQHAASFASECREALLRHLGARFLGSCC